MAIISDDENLNHTKKRNDNTVSEEISYDMSFETNIRPKVFNDYIGQSSLKSTLKISIEAAKKRELPLDHILFYGPPGLGKTTLASVIANEMNTNIKITSAPALERPRDIIGILMSLKAGDILFIDEIHRLNKISEEILYPAMEDFYLDMTTGKSQTLKSVRIPIPKFTLIGATTKAGSLSSPLRDRFGIIHRLEFYTDEELTKVIKRTAEILNIDIEENGAIAIAKRSRGTPRIANRLVKRVRDFAIVKSNGIIDEKTSNEALDILQIDKFGLDNTDRALLNIIAEKYDGGPVGIETLATALGEDTKTIEDVYLMAENEFANQNNASYSIIGKGENVYERKGALTNLQKYVINRFKDNLPPLDIDEAREQISIIDNKIQKLENLAKNDSPYFNHLYHIVLEKMRKTHHRIIGISKIPTSKVHKIYTDEAYRKSVYKTNPAPDFVEDYLNLITQGRDKRQMLESLKSFYNKVKQNIELGDEYRIPIKSKSKETTQENLSKSETISSSTIAKLDKENDLTTTDVDNVSKLFNLLKNREVKRGEKDD